MLIRKPKFYNYKEVKFYFLYNHIYYYTLKFILPIKSLIKNSYILFIKNL